MQVTGNISLFHHILFFLSPHLGIKNSCFLFGIELSCLNLSICRLPCALLLCSVDEMKMRGRSAAEEDRVMCAWGDPMALLPRWPVINWLAHSCWPEFIFCCGATVWPETWYLKEHMWSPLGSFGGPESGNTLLHALWEVMITASAELQFHLRLDSFRLLGLLSAHFPQASE